jgi:peptidyl-tRNA hydrolase
MITPGKLYIAVRADMSPGLQLAQTSHAMAQFADEYPELFKPWIQNSNYLVCVCASDEAGIWNLCTDARELGLSCSLVSEPDLEGEFTAVAIQPGVEAMKLCAQLPLALKEGAMT